MSEKAKWEEVKLRLSKLEAEANTDIQETQYLSEKVVVLRARVHQVIKAVKSSQNHD